MKSILALTAVLVTASATPLVEVASKPEIKLQSSPTEKQMIGGLSVPAAFTSTYDTKKGPVNYGNLNMGTGLMPSQNVHYGHEDHPSHGNIAPILQSTTAKEVDIQVAEAEQAKNLINADIDAGNLSHAHLSKYVDHDNEEALKWRQWPRYPGNQGYPGYPGYPWWQRPGFRGGRRRF
jgi:hypothetical protein